MDYTVLKVIKERVKNNWITIGFLIKDGSFYFDISTFIVNGGIGFPPCNAYSSFNEVKKAVYDCLMTYHRSPKQQEILRQFNFIKEFGQLDLFDEP
ncbi:hypothetical protein FACS189476_00230 [Spirochaetia bacterium]|nr:hypothetical protein FACS189476_00230 [Spirochaetia bacterium]